MMSFMISNVLGLMIFSLTHVPMQLGQTCPGLEPQTRGS